MRAIHALRAEKVILCLRSGCFSGSLPWGLAGHEAAVCPCVLGVVMHQNLLGVSLVPCSVLLRDRPKSSLDCTVIMCLLIKYLNN